jgi:Phosphotransferase enzyme family
VDSDSSRRLLSLGLTCLEQAGVDLGCYSFEIVGGGTQACVWRGLPAQSGRPVVALRLTPKPLELIGRIACLVDNVQAVECPRTLATGQVEVDGRRWTVHLCTWIGTGAGRTVDTHAVGQHLARLHQELGRSQIDFSDRRLTFERSPVPPAEALDRGLPAWYVARHLWRDRIFAWMSLHAERLENQPIHGDMHWENVVATTDGFGFIDFDKLMFAPPVFDLAKLIATGFFRIGQGARLQLRQTAELLEGYSSVRGLSDLEVVAVEGLAVMLNEEIARLGALYDVEAYRRQADTVAWWWITRRRRLRGNPLGIRGRKAEASLGATGGLQLALWADETA